MPETINTFAPPRKIPALTRLALASMPQSGPRFVSFKGLNPATPATPAPAASSAPGAHDVLTAPNPAAGHPLDGGSAAPSSDDLTTTAKLLRLGALLTVVAAVGVGAFAVLGSRKKKRKGRRG